MTGLLCPGCGTLRAWHQLLHGHLFAAMHLNILAVLSLPVAGWLLKRYLAHDRPVLPIQIQPAWLWTGAGLLILFGILRNLPFASTLWLAP